MTRVVLLATHGSRLDRAVELVAHSASGVLAEAGVGVTRSSSTSDGITAAIDRDGFASHLVFVEARELVDATAGLGDVQAHLLARRGSLEVHGLVLPFFEQAFEIWSGQVAAGSANCDFTSWLAHECEIVWARLLPAVETIGGRLLPVEPTASPVDYLLRLLDVASPPLASHVRTTGESVVSTLPRPLTAWELELCRTWNSEGRAPVGPVLAQMSSTGSPYAPSEEDASILLARFGPAVEILNASSNSGGERAQLATQQALRHVHRVSRPEREHVATPPTLTGLDRGDRMSRAVLALLLAGATP